jgi:hypothetical protein
MKTTCAGLWALTLALLDAMHRSTALPGLGVPGSSASLDDPGMLDWVTGLEVVGWSVLAALVTRMRPPRWGLVTAGVTSAVWVSLTVLVRHTDIAGSSLPPELTGGAALGEPVGVFFARYLPATVTTIVLAVVTWSALARPRPVRWTVPQRRVALALACALAVGLVVVLVPRTLLSAGDRFVWSVWDTGGRDRSGRVGMDHWYDKWRDGTVPTAKILYAAAAWSPFSDRAARCRSAGLSRAVAVAALHMGDLPMAVEQLRECADLGCIWTSAHALFDRAIDVPEMFSPPPSQLCQQWLEAFRYLQAHGIAVTGAAMNGYRRRDKPLVAVSREAIMLRDRPLAVLIPRDPAPGQPADPSPPPQAPPPMPKQTSGSPVPRPIRRGPQTLPRTGGSRVCRPPRPNACGGRP